MKQKIQPLPPEIGIGITSLTPVDPRLVSKMRYEQIGIHHNYYFTNDHFSFNWAAVFGQETKPCILDGFSPNLNKQLHIGHLRNLVLAKSLSKIFEANPCALLGASLGVLTGAGDKFDKWCDLGSIYSPEKYYDVFMPIDVINSDIRLASEGESVNGKDLTGCWIWDGPKGPVIVIKSNGQRTYAYHDLVFSKIVAPDYYITGVEQKEHFQSLGLGDKHLPMGLVLGEDGKKIKSRNGDALSADEALDMIVGNLNPSPELKNLAWNILSWNFLSTGRETNIKFEPKKWTSPNSPGMYITYTNTRIESALEDSFCDTINFDKMTSDDLKLISYACLFEYYKLMAIEKKDPSPIANFAHEMAKKLNIAYESEKIKDGREEFVYCVNGANNMLSDAMFYLGMVGVKKI